MNPKSLPTEVLDIAQQIHQHQGKAILVGGAVRDMLHFGNSPKDLDIEVYGITAKDLTSILSCYGNVSYVGKSFGVYKLTTAAGDYDFSFPRRESKIGKGHKGFQVEPDPFMSFEEAASRRDFRINAIGYDLVSQEILDPFNGQKDLSDKRLCHVSDAFSEDPLRVLRAMQFSARFEFDIAEETIALCRKLDLNELPAERMFEEFKKLLLKAKKPSLGLEQADILGVLEIFPELKALQGIQQDPQWHPEGDVWIHTLMTLDEAAKLRIGEEYRDLKIMLGVLCHDFGKVSTTQYVDGRWRSHNHEAAGIKPTKRFLARLTQQKDLIDSVCSYVKEHLKPALLHKDRDRVSDGAIRRLALRVNVEELLVVACADHWGRTTEEALNREFPAGEWLQKRLAELDVKEETLRPLLLGRHLMDLGMQPGPKIGKLLKQAYQKQLDGKFQNLEDALAWAKKKCSKT